MAQEIRLIMRLIQRLRIMWEASRWERTARRLLRDYRPADAREAMAKAAELNSMI